MSSILTSLIRSRLQKFQELCEYDSFKSRGTTLQKTIENVEIRGNSIRKRSAALGRI